MLVATISVGRRVFTGGQPPKVRPTKSRRSCGVAVDGMCTSNAAVKSTTIIVFRRRLLKLGEVDQVMLRERIPEVRTRRHVYHHLGRGEIDH